MKVDVYMYNLFSIYKNGFKLLLLLVASLKNKGHILIYREWFLYNV